MRQTTKGDVLNILGALGVHAAHANMGRLTSNELVEACKARARALRQEHERAQARIRELEAELCALRTDSEGLS